MADARRLEARLSQGTRDLLAELRDDYEKLLKAAREVRTAQKTYFRTRTQNDLIASKQAEAALDRLIR